MKVFVYHCPDAPEHHRYVARMVVKGVGSQGGSGFLPVIASAATAEDAERKLRDLWTKNGEAKLRKRGQLQPVDAEIDAQESALDRDPSAHADDTDDTDDELDGLLG